MIDEKKLKEFKFECKKIKTEKVKLNGKDVEAVITNVRLGGIFKKFWDGGEMRFRKSDGTFIYSEKMDYSNPEDKVELYSEN